MVISNKALKTGSVLVLATTLISVVPGRCGAIVKIRFSLHPTQEEIRLVLTPGWGFNKAHFGSQAEGAGIIQGEEKALGTP